MPDSIRIAVLFEYPSLNGGERSMLAVIDELRNRNSRFEFVALAPPAGPLAVALSERAVSILSFEQHQPNGTRKAPNLLRTELLSMIERVHPRVLHSNSLAMGRLTGSTANRISCSCSSHLRDIMRISKAAMADLNRNGRLAAVSRATREYHVSRGMDPRRVDVVYNGVDTSEFQPRLKSDCLIRELGLPANAFVVLTVGQIGLRKGLDVLAESAVDVCGRIRNLHFVIVGERHSVKAESIEFERGLDQRIRQAGFGNRWHRLGRRTDVSRLMNAADLLVHTAHQEPLGRVLLEAASSGLPVIATNVGGTPEILEHNFSAVLINAGDVSALSAAILQLYHDAAQRKTLAQHARQTIEESFTVELAANNLSGFWLDVVNSDIAS
jgi:glycosyltransferase involved in cell wall biosynthesis